VSGASDTLDPIQAAEAGIAGSKHLIASVANDLSQHQRWLAHYRVAERRRARRLWFQELIYQLELRRQRLMRLSTRLALIALRWARSAAAFLSRTGAAILAILHRVMTACVIWLRPRAYALALTLGEWLIAISAWTLVKSGVIARAVVKAASIGFAWIALQSRALATTLQRWLAAAGAWTHLKAGVLARASIHGAAIGSSWIAAKSCALALALQTRLSAGAAWTAARTQALARSSLATASAGFSWAVLNVRRLSLGHTHAGRQTDANHRALVVRRSTALACVEPRRSRLPAIRAG
jgi:hypothetical protein